ncbi:MAG: hypothetical protein HC934_01805 [Acaryochloridaceae cyanobacterium SU_2_1]|nr:hypothetical protein [Acaryochloridaceae cyanobacterium SU_2_1]
MIETTQNGRSSAVVMTITVKPDFEDFPGIVVIEPTGDPNWKAGVLGLRGRHLLGSKANVYYPPVSAADPSLTGSSAPEDATRPSYLNAIYSSAAQDGAIGDTMTGTLFACRLNPVIPPGITGTNLGVINSSQTLTGGGGDVLTLYQIEEIDLDGNEVLTIDTTGGPVQINLINATDTQHVVLRDNAKILNIRTDDKPPQVGDLRILNRGNGGFTLFDQSCIQGAFIWSRIDEIRFLTSGPGCPGGQNTNIEGVVWVEAILSSKNAATNRNTNYLGVTTALNDTTITPGATSGIAVPEDLSSMSDLFRYIGWPARFRFGVVKNWQRVNL